MVVGTDLHPDAVAGVGWTETHQHAQSFDAMVYPHLCPPDIFRRRVTSRYVDMNSISEDLTGFDRVWSSRAFEHLGSIALGKPFIYNMTRCLRPGGVAVHTTEFNVFSDGPTADDCGAVIDRRRDFEEMAETLPRYGCRMVERDYDPGDHPLDYVIDRLPYLNQPHLKLELSGDVATSFGLIIEEL